MKNILVFFLIALLMDGVFGESVSVTERDSVTLHTGLSEIQENDVIQWRFKTDLIAQFDMENKKISLYDAPDVRFKDRLKLDNQTGDLTIRNITSQHAGAYEVSNFYTLKRSFIVSVVSAAAAKPVSVLVGYSVTLHTDPTYIHDVMQWRYGQQKSLLAEINGAAGNFNTYDDAVDGRFRGRLDLNNQTGSLTIKNMRNTHSGLYEVEISSTRRSYTIHHTQSFNVTIRDDVELVSVLKGDNVTLCTGLTETQIIEQIRWTFGDDGKLIAYLNSTVNKTWIDSDLSHQTGDLTIRNIQRDQYGDYKVEINTRTMILYRKYNITIIDPGWSSAAVAGIVVGVLLGVAAVAGVIYYCCKKSKVIRQNHALNGTQNPGDRVNEETELTNAS